MMHSATFRFRQARLIVDYSGVADDSLGNFANLVGAESYSSCRRLASAEVGASCYWWLGGLSVDCLCCCCCCC